MNTLDPKQSIQPPFNIQVGSATWPLNWPLPAVTKDAGDDLLLQLIQEGSDKESQHALETIFVRHNKDVWRFVRSRASSGADADEIASAVWVVVIEKIYNFVWTGTPIKSWLLSIAHRKIREYYSKPRPVSLDTLTEGQEEVIQFIAVQLQLIYEPSTAVTPAVKKEADVLLHKLIGHLSNIERKIIMLIYFEEVENATEVARLLGMNKNTIRVYHKRARDKLRASPELSSLFAGGTSA